MAQGEKEYGEGNYKASREYNEATKRFVESGRVEDAARKAQPKNAQEAAEIERAEAAACERAKEEDPALHRDAGAPSGEDDPQGTRVTDRPADQTSVPSPGQGRS
jgi:hypothetical protein